MADLQSRLHTEFGAAIALRPADSSDVLTGVTPQLVAAPQTEEAAAQLVAWCGREQVVFVPFGGKTKWFIGAAPKSFDLALSTENLTEIFDWDEGNSTVEAGAGISLDNLNAHIAPKRQFVPLDAPSGSTLGGVAATNWSGGSRLKYGMPRDLVTGLHAVLSDGRLVKAGAKVVKNVSGYDLPKIFTGSFGTLGLLTRVTIRLRPRDAATSFWERPLSDWNALQLATQQISGGPFEPTSLTAHIGAASLVLRARFDGGEEAVRLQMARLEGGVAIESPENEVFPRVPWVLRAGLPLQNGLEWARAAQNAGAEETVWECGLGSVRAAFYGEFSALETEKLRALAEKFGGFVVVERAPDAAKTPDLVWGQPRDGFGLLRKLKSAFDAADVCSPGRFLGGI